MESHRDQLVTVSKQFKTTWIQFGEHLTKVASEKLWLEWGFSSFEEYCKVELNIKKNTAIKLTNAWFFLNNEPDLKDKEIDLDSASTLHKIKSDNNCTPEILSDMMDMVTKGKPPAAVKKKFRELTEDESKSPTQELFKKTGDQVKKIHNRMRPIGTVPENHIENLLSFVSFCDAEANIKPDE